MLKNIFELDFPDVILIQERENWFGKGGETWLCQRYDGISTVKVLPPFVETQVSLETKRDFSWNVYGWVPSSHWKSKPPRQDSDWVDEPQRQEPEVALLVADLLAEVCVSVV